MLNRLGPNDRALKLKNLLRIKRVANGTMKEAAFDAIVCRLLSQL